MILKIQIYSLIYSFFFGFVIYLFLELVNKFIYNNKITLRIICSLLFSLVMSIIYFYVLLLINNGILHIYFLILLFAGYVLCRYLYNKLFVKK